MDRLHPEAIELAETRDTQAQNGETRGKFTASVLLGTVALSTIALVSAGSEDSPNRTTSPTSIQTFGGGKKGEGKPSDTIFGNLYIDSPKFATVLLSKSSKHPHNPATPTTTAPPATTTTTVPVDPHMVQEYVWGLQAAEANADGKYDRLAQCETGGDWDMRGSSYSGGLGFYNGAWSDHRLDGMPYNAGDANKNEQIVVAEQIRWNVPPAGSWGNGKWGCAPTVGLP